MRWLLGSAALFIGLIGISSCAQQVSGGGSDDDDGSELTDSGDGGSGGATSGATSGPGPSTGAGASDATGSGAASSTSTGSGQGGTSTASGTTSASQSSSSSGGGSMPPPGWQCNPDYYDAGDGCDCGCGAHDLDCDDPLQDIYCSGPAEAGQQCVNDVCTAPSGWTCTEDQYAGESKGLASPTCDCGCGAYDPDCNNVANPAGGCQANEVCNTNGACIPAAWTCSPDYYGDLGCDCGCGVVDIDCADATVASCEYCSDLGSCSTDFCPGTISPSNNATCN